MLRCDWLLLGHVMRLFVTCSAPCHVQDRALSRMYRAWMSRAVWNRVSLLESTFNVQGIHTSSWRGVQVVNPERFSKYQVGSLKSQTIMIAVHLTFRAFIHPNEEECRQSIPGGLANTWWDLESQTVCLYRFCRPIESTPTFPFICLAFSSRIASF